MSVQRAIKFCRLCASHEVTIAQNQVTDYRRLLLRDYATSQAMQAVEGKKKAARKTARKTQKEEAPKKGAKKKEEKGDKKAKGAKKATKK